MAIPAIVTAIAGYVIEQRLSAAQAAERAAEEFDYYLKLSEAELTELSFALARAYPQYKYWQWFSILKTLRSYGRSIPQNGNGLPPIPNGDHVPKPTEGSKVIMYAAIGAAIIIILGGQK